MSGKCVLYTVYVCVYVYTYKYILFLNPYIDQQLDFMFLQITTNLCCQKDTGSSAEFTILFVQFALKNKFFKVDKSHGHCGLLVTTFILSQFSYLPFQAAQTNRVSKDKQKKVEPEKTIITLQRFLLT